MFAFWLAILTIGVSVQASVIDSVNARKTPDSGTFQATEVGWLYTPSFSYVLTGIEARFGVPGDFSDLITLEFYSNHPGFGGTLLRSANFLPLQDAYAGSSLAPLSLIAGKSYFVGFRNMVGESLIYTSVPGAQVLNPGAYFGFTDESLYAVGPSTGLGYESPILQFSGQFSQSEVPEPSTVLIFGMTTILFAGNRKRGRG